MLNKEIIEKLKSGSIVNLTVADNNNDITLITMNGEKLNKNSLISALSILTGYKVSRNFIEADCRCDSKISYSKDNGVLRGHKK